MTTTTEPLLKICPNCGFVLSGQEFLINVANMPNMVGLDVDPIAGRFLCPQCNYAGLPVEISKEDYKSLTFEKKTIGLPLERANPNYFKALLIIFALFVVVLAFGSTFFPWPFFLWFCAALCVLLFMKRYRS